MTIEKAKQLRKKSTDTERVLRRVLRSRQLGGCKFRRQQLLGPFIVDFVCLETRLVVEVDGGQHNEDEDLAHDQGRSQWLEREGFRVMRFWNHEVLNRLESVCDAISNALSAQQCL